MELSPWPWHATPPRALTAQALVAALDLAGTLGLERSLALWERQAQLARRARFWPPELPAEFITCLGQARAARVRGRLEKALRALSVDAALGAGPAMGS
jgi:hypothetical protein